MSTSTTFCCSLAGESVRKKSTNCPFKVTYVKNFNDAYYTLLPNFTHFHNHSLPIDEYFKSLATNQTSTGEDPEAASAKTLEKEREQILDKLLSKKEKGYSSSSQSSVDSLRSDDEKKREKKKKEKKKKKKQKKEKKKEGNGKEEIL